MAAMASQTRRHIRAACIATALTLLQFLASLLGDLYEYRRALAKRAPFVGQPMRAAMRRVARR